MSKRKKFKKLENRLLKKNIVVNEHEVNLYADDFMDDTLSASGYYRIHRECKHLLKNDTLRIIVPAAYADGLRKALETYGSRELKHIRQERFDVRLAAFLLLFGGVGFLMLGVFLQKFSELALVNEVTVIASWVFVWAAVEKFFFEQKHLRDKRYLILQILTAEIAVVEE